jgi:hypothetical protein
MIVVAVAAGATIVACGGSSTPKKPDAKVFHDAPGSAIDAPGGSATGIGADCTGTGSGNGTCPTSDPICTTLTGTKYFCTESCGYGSCATGGTFGSSSCTCNGSGCPNNGSAGAYPSAPTGGDTICMGQKSGTTATPFCALYGNGPSAGSAIAWACGLVCGTSGSANFGTCPSNLTCTSNFCQ